MLDGGVGRREIASVHGFQSAINIHEESIEMLAVDEDGVEGESTDIACS